MKKKLLFLVLAGFAFTTISTAQTVWDFGNSTDWPVVSGYETNTVVQNFGIFPGANPEGVAYSNTGQVESSNSGAFTDGYTATKRFKFNGSSYEGGFSPLTTPPTKRYFYFAVAGPVTVKVWFRTGGSGLRTVYVTDGSNVIGSLGSETSGDRLILTANYTGTAATNLFITSDNGNNIMKIEVTGTLGTTQTLGIDDFNQVTTKVHSYKDQVFISNVLTASEVKVYNIMGALVKSFTTTTDTDFQLNQSGLYIVNIKTEEGEKSVKVALN